MRANRDTDGGTPELRQRLAEAMTRAYQASGKTQAAIAVELRDVSGGSELPLRMLTRYLKGQSKVNVEFLARFAEVCNTSVEAILRDAGVLTTKIDVQAVIDNAPELDRQWREMLKVTYEAAVRDSAARSTNGIGRRLR